MKAGDRFEEETPPTAGHERQFIRPVNLTDKYRFTAYELQPYTGRCELRIHDASECEIRPSPGLGVWFGFSP